MGTLEKRTGNGSQITGSPRKAITELVPDVHPSWIQEPHASEGQRSKGARSEFRGCQRCLFGEREPSRSTLCSLLSQWTHTKQCQKKLRNPQAAVPAACIGRPFYEAAPLAPIVMRLTGGSHLAGSGTGIYSKTFFHVGLGPGTTGSTLQTTNPDHQAEES